jgi:hypothetical protein
VNLREERGAHQLGLEQPFVVPVRIVLFELVADGIVLQRKQGVQQAESNPRSVKPVIGLPV